MWFAGGYIVFTASVKGKSGNKELAENLEPAIKTLETQGLWSSLGTIYEELMTENSPGWVFRFQVADQK